MRVFPRKGLQRNLRSAAKQIGAESPTPHSGDAPKKRTGKPDFKAKYRNQPRMQTPFSKLKAHSKARFRYANAERMRNPLAGSRVCKPPFSKLKAHSKARFRYANAERMRNPLAGSRVCKAHFSNSKAHSKALFGYAGAERI
jgi:hypothetical protein